MLVFKLLIVPLFLAGISIAARIWGPRLGGLLAGLPVVAGPILCFLALEHGVPFAAQAAQGSLLAVIACIGFATAFAHASRRFGWLTTLLIGWSSWFVLAAALAWLPAQLPLVASMAGVALLLGPRMLPSAPAVAPASSGLSKIELGARMLAGAALVLAVTGLAAIVGTRWAGLLAMFPVLGTVLGVFSHLRGGPDHVALLYRGMFRGFFSFAAFCVVLALVLEQMSLPLAFILAVVAAALVQAGFYWYLSGARRDERDATTRAATVDAGGLHQAETP
jgi:hypothetical protein